MELGPWDEKVYTQTICKSLSPSNGQLEVMWTGSKANVKVLMSCGIVIIANSTENREITLQCPSRDDNTWLKANKSTDTGLMKAVIEPMDKPFAIG